MALVREECEKSICPTCKGGRVVHDRWGFWREAFLRGLRSDDMEALRRLAEELGIANDQYPDRNPGWLPPEEEPCSTCGGTGQVCQERTTLAYDRDGQVVVVRGVPGVVADTGGEFLGYSEEVVERVRLLVGRARSQWPDAECITVEYDTQNIVPAMTRTTRGEP